MKRNFGRRESRVTAVAEMGLYPDWSCASVETKAPTPLCNYIRVRVSDHIRGREIFVKCQDGGMVSKFSNHNYTRYLLHAVSRT